MSYNYKKIDNSINEKHAIIQIENIQFDNVLAKKVGSCDLIILKKRNDIKYSYRISKSEKHEASTARVRFIKQKLINGMYLIIKCVFNKKCDCNTVLYI